MYLVNDFCRDVCPYASAEKYPEIKICKILDGLSNKEDCPAHMFARYISHRIACVEYPIIRMKKVDVLDYKIEIVKDSDGDYIARIPKLGCMADGKTIDEAINELIEVAEDFLRLAEEDGKHIPMPEKNEEENYSGKFG